jgi:hypothetical protein
MGKWWMRRRKSVDVFVARWGKSNLRMVFHRFYYYELSREKKFYFKY